MVEWIIFGTALAFLGLLGLDTWRLGAPPMPSSAAERRAVLALLARSVEGKRSAVTILEAGAGWGGLALAMARAQPHCSVVAVEGAVAPAMVCWLRARLLRARGGPLVRVHLGDVRRVDVGSVDMAVAFLGPEPTALLAEHLASTQPGVEVISVGFALRGWHRRLRIQLADPWLTEVALWTARPQTEAPAEPGRVASGSLE